MSRDQVETTLYASRWLGRHFFNTYESLEVVQRELVIGRTVQMSSKRKLEDCDVDQDGKDHDHTRKKLVYQAPSQKEQAPGGGASILNASPQIPESNLVPLLDFSSLTTAEEISSRFESVAHELLCNTILTVVRNGTRTDLEILELEFYLQKSGCHEDPFTHGSVEQERSGQWYFHRSPRRADASQPGLPVTAGGGYRGGTRKGLDLTIGGPTMLTTSKGPVTIRGGALLRTIRRCGDKKLICGPSLLVDELLRLGGTSSIEDLVNTAWSGDISALSPPTVERNTFMYLRRENRGTSGDKRPSVYCSPRIGLDLSHPDTTESVTHPRIMFVGKPYRYFTCPPLLTSKGRVQTFVGLYAILRESKGYPDDSLELRKAIADVWGVKEQIVAKNMADYRSGYQVGRLKSFIGSSGKGVCQSASKYLEMMGALRKALQQ